MSPENHQTRAQRLYWCGPEPFRGVPRGTTDRRLQVNIFFDPELYIANFVAAHGREPNFIPSGNFYVNDRGEYRPMWISNKKK